jgi:glutathione peroxidase
MFSACLLVAAVSAAEVSKKKEVSPVLDFKVKDIKGNDVYLGDYQGDVLLIVNVASKCGLTPQYDALEALYRKHKDQGFKILGFPANNFLSQEPGTNEEIQTFCKTKYDVTFDLFSKVSVKGDDQCDLYKFLTDDTKNAGFGGEIKWNFQKFLVGRDGKMIARFDPKTTPDDPKVVEAVENALKAPAK